jgi:hypothetical protein
MTWRPRRSERGTGIILALLVLAAFAILMVMVWNLARELTRESLFEKRVAQAQTIAEAGMEDALHSLYIHPAWSKGFTNKAFAGGTYTVTVSTDNPPWITSKGYSEAIPRFGTAVRTVKARLLIDKAATQGTVAGTKYTVDGVVNSYDSSVSTNPASFGSAAPVWSNATMAETAGTDDIFGNATYYSGTAPKSTEVTGTITKSTYTIALSSQSGTEYATVNDNLTGFTPQSDYTAATQDITIAAATTATLEPGVYYFGAVVVNGTLNVNTATGTVTVFLTGNLNKSGTAATSMIVNVSGIPGRFQIFSASAITLYLESSTPLQVEIDAPLATIKVDQFVYGQLIADTITISAGNALHYDIEFNNMPTHATWQPGTWSLSY